TTEYYTLSLHDALPIYKSINTVQYKNLMNSLSEMQIKLDKFTKVVDGLDGTLTSNKKETEKEINQLKNTIENLSNKNYNSDNVRDRKSTRLNSSHVKIS